MNSTPVSLPKRLRKLMPIPLILGIVTALLTYFRMSSNQSFISQWLPFYGLALFIVAPIAMTVISKYNPLVVKHLGDKHIIIQGLSFSIPALGFIGSVMTGVSVLSFHSIESVSQFFSLWQKALIHSLPVIFTISLVVGGVVKPLISLRKQKKG